MGAQTRFRGFLVPLAAVSMILSTLGQSVFIKSRPKKIEWILIGNQMERETISNELMSESRDLQTRTTFAQFRKDYHNLTANGSGTRGVAVGDIEENTDIEMDELLKFRERGERVIPLLSWCEQELQRIPPELIHTEWLIQAEGFGLRPGRTSWRIKRCGDVTGAMALILITAPLMMIAAAMIWLEDRGPVLYQQIRTGLYGRPIRIFKLRSMRVDAERNGAQWATKGDPRITAIGRVIRATRIDELPQLFSVLDGDLSLIGPRPERPEIEKELEVHLPNYRIRHWIRPGLSGWAQVCYPYGASIDDSRNKLSYDLFYIRNQGILLDILILIKTLRLVVTAKGYTPKSMA